MPGSTAGREAPPAAAADARAAGLRYVNDAEPGFRRERHGRGFAYRTAAGELIRDEATIGRIKRLAIPPAWTDVWICADDRGHLQATGRDARQRKQYRYHPAFRARRDRDKYARTERFARVLPRIRRRIQRDLAGTSTGRRRGKRAAASGGASEAAAGASSGARPDGSLARDRVLAAAVRLLERTLIRVGNDEYARENRSFGVATLKDRHARVRGSEVRIRFRGKAGRVHEVSFRDQRLAAIVRRCRDLPGQELFQWVDADGTVRDVRSDDINAYIREAAGSDEFSAKDFRTWAGTVLAFRALAATGQGVGAPPGDSAGDTEAAGNTAAPPSRPSATALRRAVNAAAEAAAEQLGNTPTVARQAYVHPAVIDAYLEGGVRDAILSAADVDPALPVPPTPAEERAVLALLSDRARSERSRGRAGRGHGRARSPAGRATGATPNRARSEGRPGRRRR
ncbi:MAG TPA: hypothetical protein VGI98_01360 [Candidatus Limnocylindrales bacterium]